MTDVNRNIQEKIQETRGSVMVGQTPTPVETTTRGSSSQQAGGQAVRETTTRGSSEMQESMGPPPLHTTRGSSEYARSLCERENAMGDRERSLAWSGEESGGTQTGRGTQSPKPGSDRWYGLQPPICGRTPPDRREPMRHARTYDAPINLAVLALAAAHFDAPPEVVVGDAALPAGGLLRPGGFHRPEGDERRAFPADRPELPSGWSGREPGAPR